MATESVEQPTGSLSQDGSSDNSVLLDVSDLHVRFSTPEGVVHAVRGASFQLNAGEVLGIVGESGSGKSVTSLAIMGLLPRGARAGGSITFQGKELLGFSDREMSRIRGRRIAMVFQDPMTSLNPVYRIGHQLIEAIQIHNPDISDKQARERAAELLEIVDIPHPAARLDSFPHEFSGGMRQRVVIAMAIANQPDVIIADEPTTALDVTVQAQVLATLAKARQETNASVILITHDLGVVAGLADRVLVMYAGRPVEVGGVEDIYYRSRMPYTIGLLGSLPRLDSGEQRRLMPIPGVPPSLLNMPPGCPFSPRCPIQESRCENEEPELRAVTDPAHRAACFFSEKLSSSSVPIFDNFSLADGEGSAK